MKILIRIPVWKRYELTDAIFEKTLAMIDSVGTQYGYHFQILVLYSEDEYKKSPYFHHKLFTWVYTTNEHLGKKLNEGLSYAMQHMDFDYMMELGSDDIVHESAWKVYSSGLAKQWNCFGFTDVEIREWIGPGLQFNRSAIVRYNQVVGAGRMISKNCLRRSSEHLKVRFKRTMLFFKDESYLSGNKGDIRYIPIHSYDSTLHEVIDNVKKYILWDEEVTMGNDITAERRIKQAGYPIHDLPGPFIIDYKTEDNLQGFDWLLSRIESVAVD